MFRMPIIIPRKPNSDITNPHGYIYITTNLVNNKKYLGKHSKQKLDKHYLGSGIAIMEAVQKYGRNNFISEPIEWCDSPEKLDERELWWTQFLEVVKSDQYYNEIEGGTGYQGGELHPFYGGKNHPFYGKRLSPEHVEHMSCSLTGRKLSEEHKRHISEGLKGKMSGENNPMYGYKWSNEQKLKWKEERTGTGNPFYGKHHSEKTKELIRNNLPDQRGENNSNYGHKWSEKQRANNNTARPVVQLTMSYEFVAEYPYIRAAKGFNGGYIGQCCRGKKDSYKGYRWMFKEDYEKFIQK